MPTKSYPKKHKGKEIKMKNTQMAVDRFAKIVEEMFPGDPLELFNDGTAEEIREIAENCEIEDIDFDCYIDDLLDRIGTTYKLRDGLDYEVEEELGWNVSREMRWTPADVRTDAENLGMTVGEFIDRYLEVEN